MIIIDDIYNICKLYREEVLKMSLTDVATLTGVSKSTLSSFENGRSTNLKHLVNYYNLGTDEQKQKLMLMLRKGEERMTNLNDVKDEMEMVLEHYEKEKAFRDVLKSNITLIKRQCEMILDNIENEVDTKTMTSDVVDLVVLMNHFTKN